MNTQEASNPRIGLTLGLSLVTGALAAILFVLPAEYGIDPTGVGKALGIDGMSGVSVSALSRNVEPYRTDEVEFPLMPFEDYETSITEAHQLGLKLAIHAIGDQANDRLLDIFEKIGPLVEVNVPVDKNSNKATGFAFVTFMMPEHAVTALSKLDGKIFQGRILHLLPGKAKKTKMDEIDGKGNSIVGLHMILTMTLWF